MSVRTSTLKDVVEEWSRRQSVTLCSHKNHFWEEPIQNGNSIQRIHTGLSTCDTATSRLIDKLSTDISNNESQRIFLFCCSFANPFYLWLRTVSGAAGVIETSAYVFCVQCFSFQPGVLQPAVAHSDLFNAR